MRKHSVLTVIAASLLLALGQNAVACSLGGRQLTVQLEEGGAELGAPPMATQIPPPMATSNSPT